MNVIKAKRNYIIALALLFVFVSLSETTYSLFLTSNSTDEFTYNTGTLDLQFVEDEMITLQNVFPMLDSDGINLEPYKLVIKNTGSLAYLFDLTMASSTEEDAIDTRYIKVKVNEYAPHTLYETANVLANDVTIYPGEELTFKINVWLDLNTPNKELGKTFSAQVITKGSSFYKTLDTSGANSPMLTSDMLPIYYNEDTSSWHVANKSNILSTETWYDYDSRMWANSITLKNDDNKYIYDITRNNDILATDMKFNNGNLVIDEKYFDTNIANYSDRYITNIFRMKVNAVYSNIYILSNDNMTYYYDNSKECFVFKIGNSYVTSSKYTLKENEWYILGYSYDGQTVSFYINGEKLSSASISGTIDSTSTFKIGTDSTKREITEITVGNILVYDRILSDEEITRNFSMNMSVILDGLKSGYEEFIPMTLKEYYLSRESGFEIDNDDVLDYYVWIPRFKYMVWNVTGEAGIDSYDAYHKGIGIIFETDTETTGVIYCENDVCYNNDLKVTKVNQIDNGKYYTHPAFTDGDSELKGFWVSKYELSLNDNTIGSKLDANVWNNNSVSNYINSLTNIGNHMIKNTEWGAILYLSHSKYGLCAKNKCSDIGINTTDKSGANDKDTTTGNKYGIYDMAGSYSNITASKYNDEDLFDNEYEIYTNTFILGDATNEILLKEGIWDNASYSNIDSTNKWIIRGGYKNGGMFGMRASDGLANPDISTRMVKR